MVVVVKLITLNLQDFQSIPRLAPVSYRLLASGFRSTITSQLVTADDAPSSELLSPSSERFLGECVTDAGCPTAALPFCVKKKTTFGYKKACAECATSADCPVDAQPCDTATKTCRGPRAVPTITTLVQFPSLENADAEDGDILCNNLMSSIYIPNGICRIDGILEPSNVVVVSIYTFDDSIEAFNGMAELLGLLTSNSLELRDTLSKNLEQFGVPTIPSSSYEMVVYHPKVMAQGLTSNVKVPSVVSTAFASLSCSSKAHISWLPSTPSKFNPTYISYVVVCSSVNDVVAKSVPGYRIDTSIDLRNLNETYTCKVASVTLESSLSDFIDSAPFVNLLPNVCVRSVTSNSSRSYPCPSGDAPCFCNYVGQPGLYADTKVGCQDYYQCGGAAGDFYRPCPSGLLFDNKIQACNYPSLVDCGVGPTPPPPPSPPSPPPPSPPSPPPPSPPPPSPPSPSYPCNSGDAACFCAWVGSPGLYADTKATCSFYYQCTGSQSFYRPCPTGLQFDNALQACNYPEYVDCGGVSPSPPSPPPPSPPPSPSPPSPPPPSPPSPPSPPGPSSSKQYGGYFPTWSMPWSSNPNSNRLSDLPPYVTQVFLSFMKPDTTYSGGTTFLGTGLQFPGEDMAPIIKQSVAILKQRNPGTKVLVAVGGYAYTGWAKLNTAGIKAFVDAFGLDGVDIDYEPAAPNCQRTGCSGNVCTGVSCTTDQQFQQVVRSIRQAMPDKFITVAAFSVGAYGVGSYTNAQPISQNTGVLYNMLKAVGDQISQVNIMSYDAGPTYDPLTALDAYASIYSGPILVGVEVANEAWGGHVISLAEVNTIANGVIQRNAAGMMIWSLDKRADQGPTATQISQTVCTDFGLQKCTCGLSCPSA